MSGRTPKAAQRFNLIIKLKGLRMYTLQWVDFGVNVIVLVAVSIVVGILLNWMKLVVQFVDLMNEVGQEEMLLKSRLEEWHDLIKEED